MKQSKFNIIRKLISLIGLVILCYACQKDSEPQIQLPELRTLEISNIAYNKVTCGGSIIKDGGEEIVKRGICWGTESKPTVDDYYDLDPLIEKNDFLIDLGNLASNTTYFVRAFATNSQGTSYGQEISFTLWLNLPDEPVTDIDDNSYSTVRVGNQVWMQENLKVAHYRNGDPIIHLTMQNDNEWLKTRSGSYCSYDDEVINADKYGYLYNGYTIFDNRAVCPEGWHIPTKEEWETLINYLGGIYTSGNMLKGNNYWEDLDPEANNLSGFTAIPGGVRLAFKGDESTSSRYWHGKKTGFFASQDEYTYDSNRIWYIQIFNEGGNVQLHYNISKNCGQSIRCIKD